MSRLPTPDGPTPIRRIEERLAYANRFVTIYDDHVLIADQPGAYLRIVESSGEPGVACIATCADRMALVLTYRYPIGRWQWGVPRGFGSDADPARSLVTEMREELGSEPATVTELGRITTNSGLLASQVVVYHGSWDIAPAQSKDDVEVHGVAWLTLDEVMSEVQGGTLDDGVTLAALMLARARGALR